MGSAPFCALMVNGGLPLLYPLAGDAVNAGGRASQRPACHRLEKSFYFY